MGESLDEEKKKRPKKPVKENMALPPAFPESFYRLLTQGAQQLGVSRVRFVMDAMRHYLRAMENKNAPMAKALGSEELAKKYGEARGKLAKKWWSTVSEEERRERAQKAIQARWAKKREQEPPAE